MIDLVGLVRLGQLVILELACASHRPLITAPLPPDGYLVELLRLAELLDEELYLSGR